MTCYIEKNRYHVGQRSQRAENGENLTLEALHLNDTKGIEEMPVLNEILQRALTLKPAEKAELIDKLLSSLDMPDKEVDELWAKEAEDRIEAYDQGKIKAIALEKVLEKCK